jgi:hypothetical protein
LLKDSQTKQYVEAQTQEIGYSPQQKRPWIQLDYTPFTSTMNEEREAYMNGQKIMLCIWNTSLSKEEEPEETYISTGGHLLRYQLYNILIKK